MIEKAGSPHSLRRIGVNLGIGLVVLILLYGILQILPPRSKVEGNGLWLRPASGRPWIMAHGGGQGLHPPNTLEAFEASVQGADVLEMDIRITRDGELVTLHDDTVERTSDGHGKARDFKLAELKALNFGAHFKDPAGLQTYRDHPARIATLAEVFSRFGKLPMVIELKDRGEDGRAAADRLWSLVQSNQMTSRVLVASFDDATLEYFREISGRQVTTSSAMSATKSVVIFNKLRLDWFAPTGHQALQIPVQKMGYRLDTAALIGAAHRRGVAVHYWTVNDPGEMKRLIELGADGLLTDRPDVMRKVLKEMGYP